MLNKGVKKIRKKVTEFHRLRKFLLLGVFLSSFFVSGFKAKMEQPLYHFWEILISYCLSPFENIVKVVLCSKTDRNILSGNLKMQFGEFHQNKIPCTRKSPNKGLSKYIAGLNKRRKM